MTRDDLRNEFENKGFSYKDLSSKEVAKLRRLIESELKEFYNNGFRMKLRSLRSNDIGYDADGALKKCYFMVDGCVDGEKPYFKRREAISFNEGGFIGFSGWADGTNVQPFLKAFQKFLYEIQPKT